MNAEGSSSRSLTPKPVRSPAPPAASTGLTFNVRFTDGKTEDLLGLWVSSRETVREVSRRMRLLRAGTIASRRLRLIFSGRVLTDGIFLVPWTVSLLEKQKQYEAGQSRLIEDALEGLGDVVKSVAGEDAADKGGKGKGKATARGEAAVEQLPVWLNCSVGEIEEPDATSTAPAMQEPQIEPLKGFDRLRDAGFSEDEIRNMREQFHEDGGTDEATIDDTEHARALEDQWMEGAQPEMGVEPSASGHYMGSIIGFALPLLPFFFFRTQIFSRRFQMAIMLGFTINLAFGVLHFFA